MRTSILIIILLLAFFASSSPVSADWPVSGELDGCHVFDFTIDDQGWSTDSNWGYTAGTYSAGSGWTTTDEFINDRYWRILNITLDGFAWTTVTSMTATYNYWSGSTDNYNQVALVWAINDEGISALSFASTFDGNGRENSVYPDPPIVTQGYLEFSLRTSYKFSASYSGTALVTAMEVCGTPEAPDPEYIKPLLTSDIDGWGMYEHAGNGGYTVVAFSQEPFAYVRSAVNGIVYSIDEIQGGDCNDVLDVFLLECAIRVPSSVHGGSGEYIYTFADLTFNQGDVTYKVVIKETGEENYFTYFVREAPNYIIEGQVVEPGCYLGKTDEMAGYDFSLEELLAGNISGVLTPPASQGVTIVYLSESAGGSPVELLDYLVLNPAESNPCNVTGDYYDCLGSADLSNQKDWQSYGNVAWNSPGATLGTSAYISSVMNLEAERLPQMRVSAKTHTGNGRIELRIGETTQTFPVSNTQFAEFKIDGAEHTPSSGVFYDIVVANVGSTTLEIEFICVSFTLDEDYNPKDDPPPPPCYFVNHSFDDGPADWDITWSNLEPDGGGGAIYPPDDGTWTQAVSLHPGDSGPATYTIRAVFGLNAYASYTPDETDATATAAIQYDFPAPTGYTTISSAVTFGQIAQSGGTVTVQDTFVVSSDMSGDFRFKAVMTDEPADVPHLAIQSVCLDAGNTTDGSAPEPYPGDWDYGEPVAGEDNATCDVVTRPSGNNLSDWSVWSWKKFNNFFECELMVLLNKMYDKLIDLYQLIGWVARWLQAYLYSAGDWLTTEFVPWLGGHFTNMKGGGWIIGTEQPEEDGGCKWYDVFCHAGNLLGGVEDLLGGVWDGVGDITNVIGDTLAWVMGAIQYLFDGVISPVWNFIKGALDWVLGILGSVVKPVLDWIIDLISSIADWIAYIWQLLLDTIGAYNSASPQSVPGFPDCAVDTSNAICLFYWVTENTVFAGTAGGLIIPLMSSILAIMFILHYIKQIKTALSETAVQT